MLDKMIQELTQKNELDNIEWLLCSSLYADETCINKKMSFLKALSTHSGIPSLELCNALKTLSDPKLSSSSQTQILANLQEMQTSATLEIAAFQEHSIFKGIDIDVLAISRAHWNALITKFKQQERQKLTMSFFLSALSSIKRVTQETLVDSMSHVQPERAKKRKISQENPPAKRVLRPYVKDNGINPLIYKSEINNPEDKGHIEFETQLEATGVRIVPSLTACSPEKSYPDLMRTPGKHKVRPVCTIDGQRFFKPLTPYSKEPKTGRVDVSSASKKEIEKSLPKLLSERAEPVKYVATLEGITERSGKQRGASQSARMGASAAAVFRAHGIEIESADGRSIHWAHLIAHFLADTQDIGTEHSDKEIINLVPSTAAANYNTLEMIELFIRDKLVKKETDQIQIHVDPKYSEESLIPNLLVYDLTWKEENKKGLMIQCHETFYINPQSYLRITKSMHGSISVLRNARKTLMFDSTSAAPEDDWIASHNHNMDINL